MNAPKLPRPAPLSPNQSIEKDLIQDHLTQKLWLDDDWQELRQFTAARIALGRAGASLPTDAMLAFQLAHARARDAVHLELNTEKIACEFSDSGFETLTVHSAATDRQMYLQRPDFGRILSPTSRTTLTEYAQHKSGSCDIVFVIADGLSALAIHHNAAPFATTLIKKLRADGWNIAPIVITHQGRVAIGDEIGKLLNAKIAVVLIGERPGLSSPDSMGIYLTWAPQPGLTDAARNCISNVRAGGLSLAEASYRLNYLLNEASSRQLSGVELKDESDGKADSLDEARNFLIDN